MQAVNQQSKKHSFFNGHTYTAINAMYLFLLPLLLFSLSLKCYEATNGKFPIFNSCSSNIVPLTEAVNDRGTITTNNVLQTVTSV